MGFSPQTTICLSAPGSLFCLHCSPEGVQAIDTAWAYLIDIADLLCCVRHHFHLTNSAWFPRFYSLGGRNAKPEPFGCGSTTSACISRGLRLKSAQPKPGLIQSAPETDLTSPFGFTSPFLNTTLQNDVTFFFPSLRRDRVPIQ